MWLEMKASGLEYLPYRCCMCPNIKTPHDMLCACGRPCRFVKAYKDRRGWIYAVLPGIGENTFKARYKKPGGDTWKGVAKLSWRDSFDQAQSDLNGLAKKEGWGEDSASTA